jgi:hypothetical protein
MGIKVVSKVTRKPSRQKNLDNRIKRMGYKSCQELHANPQDKNLDNGKRIPVVKQGSETTENGRKTTLQSNRQRKLE